MTPEQRAFRERKSQEILRLALQEIRALGFAPIFRWGKTYDGTPSKLAVNIDDFNGFHELGVTRPQSSTVTTNPTK